MAESAAVVQTFLSFSNALETAQKLCIACTRGQWSSELDEDGLLSICHLPRSKLHELRTVLGRGAERGLFESSTSKTWRVIADATEISTLSALLTGAALHKAHALTETGSAQIVMTHPKAGARLAGVLRERGSVGASIVDTDACFHALALSATRRLVVASPFVDAHGLDFLNELFVRTEKTVICTLVTRVSDAGGLVFRFARAVELFDYKSEIKEMGYETFHAKVVLADEHSCYLGSANVNWASLRTTLELGVWLRGPAASDVASVVDGIISSSVRC
jgi:hypothetical protein